MYKKTITAQPIRIFHLSDSAVLIPLKSPAKLSYHFLTVIVALPFNFTNTVPSKGSRA